MVTEALDVTEYVAVRRFHTANRMRIMKKGIVYAAVRADELVVEGVLEGAALSMGGIRIGKKARVKADLRGLRLTFEMGAEFSGDVRIGPEQVPELQNLVSAP